MFSKEDLVMRIQQGMPEASWTIVRPQSSYFLKQVLIWFILFLLPIGATIFYLNTPDHALVLTGASLDSDSALQMWRTIDFIVFGVLALGFLAMLVEQVQNLLAREQQMLVLTPQAFYMKLRKKEYFVDYANIASIAPVAQRDGNVKLKIRANNGQTSQVELDNRFGKAKELAPQIIITQRQAVAPPNG